MPKKRILLLHQGVWRAKGSDRLPPMPLACGYLKAAIESDDRLRNEVEVTIVSLPGGESLMNVLGRAILDHLPDFIGFSVLGWNYDLFGRVADVYRRLQPNGWIVFGGTHVANQADRVFRMFPCVDVVVNGEGEWVFLDLLRAWLAGVSPQALHDISGISFQASEGAVVTTAPVARIQDLNQIPSPFLTGALPLTGKDGRFNFDSAVMETNRGCPYRCSFCYWGGAVGQRVRAFAIDRLREEMEVLARAGASHIMLCDANFGMLAQDEEFIEICIRTRERYGYPKTIMTSWAKDKRKPFYRAVSRMKEAGFQSSFNLALQTLTEPALETMQRQNMRINEWKDLADWLHAQGMTVYAELIWGCPGDTCESFLEGYDELARHVTRIATYPLLLLPNTKYVEDKEKLQIVTWRTNTDDFERVLSHHSMSLADNRRMHGFLFWSRVIAEHLLLRHVWKPLLTLGAIKQSQLLLSFDYWLAAQSDPVATYLRSSRDRAVEELDLGSGLIEQGLQFFFADSNADVLMMRWWDEAIHPQLPELSRNLLRDIFRFDWFTRPIYATSNNSVPPTAEKDGELFYVRDNMTFNHDIIGLLQQQTLPESTALRQVWRYRFYYPMGFCNDMALYHNAQNESYCARIEPIQD